MLHQKEEADEKEEDPRQEPQGGTREAGGGVPRVSAPPRRETPTPMGAGQTAAGCVYSRGWGC